MLEIIEKEATVLQLTYDRERYKRYITYLKNQIESYRITKEHEMAVICIQNMQNRLRSLNIAFLPYDQWGREDTR